MPQLDVFLDKLDAAQLVKRLTDRSCYLVPDVDYSYPSVEEWKIENADQFLSCREQTKASLFFVVSPEYACYPLEFRKIEKAGKICYYIAQKAGGPTLDLFLPARFVENGTQHLPSGFIGYHNKYWNPETQRMESAPPELKSLYQGISSELRTNGTIKRGTHRAYVIGPQTLKAAACGLVLTNPSIS